MGLLLEVKLSLLKKNSLAVLKQLNYRLHFTILNYLKYNNLQV